MNKSKFYFAIAFSILFLLSFSTTFAQTKNETKPKQNYEIIIQTLIPSNSSAKNNSIIPSLANAIKKLKETFSFNNYDLASTHFGRTENGGNISYKGVSDSFSKNNEKFSIFIESNLIEVNKEESSSNTVSIKSFSFGARVPVVTSNFENKEKSPVVNYESVGILIQKLNVRENDPTIIGTLTLRNDNQMAFIIMTVKPVE